GSPWRGRGRRTRNRGRTPTTSRSLSPCPTPNPPHGLPEILPPRRRSRQMSPSRQRQPSTQGCPRKQRCPRRLSGGLQRIPCFSRRSSAQNPARPTSQQVDLEVGVPCI